MKENKEKTKEDDIRYRFTGYVLAAIKRTRRDYINREMKISGHESPLEELLLEPSFDGTDGKAFSWEETEQLPMTPKAARQYLENQAGESGKEALDTLTDTEILVVFMKVFRQFTYAQIGRHLGMDWKKAGSVFTYARKKMRKGWKDQNGV